MQDSINNEKDVKSLIIRVKVKENCLEIYKEICEQTFMAIHSSLKSVIGITLSENISQKNTLDYYITFANEEEISNLFNSPIFALYMANHSQIGESIEVELNQPISNIAQNIIKNNYLKVIEKKIFYSFKRE